MVVLWVLDHSDLPVHVDVRGTVELLVAMAQSSDNVLGLLKVT